MFGAEIVPLANDIPTRNMSDRDLLIATYERLNGVAHVVQHLEPRVCELEKQMVKLEPLTLLPEKLDKLSNEYHVDKSSAKGGWWTAKRAGSTIGTTAALIAAAASVFWILYRTTIGKGI